MIATGAAPGKLVPPQCKRNAAVRALIMKGVNLASFAKKHQLLAEQLNRKNLLADPPGKSHRIPVVAKPEHRPIVLGPRTYRSALIARRVILSISRWSR